MRRHRGSLVIGCIVLLALVLVGAGLAVVAPAQAVAGDVEYGWTVTNLTNTPHVDEELPDIYGDYIIWNTYGDGHDDVYLYDLTTGTKENLTDSPDVEEYGAAISDRYAMWSAVGGQVGADIEMNGVDLVTGAPLYSDDNVDQEWPSLAGDWAVWEFMTGGYGQISAWNIETLDEIAFVDDLDDWAPRTDGNQMVWYGDDGDNFEIYYLDFGWEDYNAVKLTTSPGNARYPDIDGDHVVWVDTPANDDDAGDIMFYDLDPLPGEDELVVLTNDSATDGMPRVSGDWVVWERDVPGGVEVRLWDRNTGETVVLSGGVAWAMEPNIDGFSVVWEGATSSNGQTDIYLAQYVYEPIQSFPDVSPSHSYFEAVEGMFGLDIISGYTNGYFGVGDQVKRQQFAKMILGTFALEPKPTTATRFTDLGTPDSQGYPHRWVQAAYEWGITKGKNLAATLYAPTEPIRRDQMATMVVRAIDQLYPGVLEAPPASYVSPFAGVPEPHGSNLRVAEYNGLLDGLVGMGPGWKEATNATRGEVAQVLWNVILLVGYGE